MWRNEIATSEIITDSEHFRRLVTGCEKEHLASRITESAVANLVTLNLGGGKESVVIIGWIIEGCKYIKR